MNWINIFGLVFIITMMVPNLIFSLKCKNGFINLWNNKLVETLEQIGRFGCFGFMFICVPGTCFGFWSDEAFAIYLLIDTILLFFYCLIWIICFRRNTLFRALALSIIPSVMFLSSGILSRSILLVIFSLIFAPCHIFISYKNCILSK